MQIHELNTFSGTPGTGDYLAIDNGSETSKVEASVLVDSFKVLVIEGNVSSLPMTINNSDIKSDMVVLNSELGTPSAQTSDWTVETSDGSLSISGTISGTTSIKLYLASQR